MPTEEEMILDNFTIVSDALEEAEKEQKSDDRQKQP